GQETSDVRNRYEEVSNAIRYRKWTLARRAARFGRQFSVRKRVPRRARRGRPDRRPGFAWRQALLAVQAIFSQRRTGSALRLWTDRLLRMYSGLVVFFLYANGRH